MATYPDTFNRADGPLGDDWTVYSGSMSIVSNMAHASTPAWAVAANDSESGDQTHYVVVPVVGGLIAAARVVLKKASDSGNCWWARVSTAGASMRVSVGYVYGGSDIESSHTDTTMPADGLITLTGTFTSTTITAEVGATSASVANDHSYDAQAGFGFALSDNDSVIDAFDAPGGATASMAITPDPVWVGGGLVVLTATGSGTNWDPENASDTTFSADHGTVTAQSITSATSVTLFYTPADYLGSITFSETKYSLQDTISSTVIPPEGQGGGACPFDQDFIDTANATVEADNRGLPTLQTVVVPAAHGWPNVMLLEAIGDIWYSIFRPGDVPPGGITDPTQFVQLLQLIAGDENPTVQLYEQQRNTSIREELEGVTDRLVTLIGAEEWTLDDILHNLAGEPIANHQDILSAIAAIDPGSNQDVLDALAAYFGVNPPTIAQLGTMVSDIATIAGYNLGDVLDAIAAIPGVDLTPITDKLTLIQPSTDYNLTTIDTDLSDLHSDVDVVRVDVNDIRTENNYTLGTVMDRLDDIMTALGGVSATSLPLWPGLAGVTLGTEVALADDLVIDGPLHGLLFTITGQPEHTQKYMFGDVASWARVGQVLFTTDRGDYERSQSFGIDAQVLTPLTMEVAASAVLRVNPNWTGTVRPWTRT